VSSSWLPRRKFNENRAQSARELVVRRVFGTCPSPDEIGAAGLQMRKVVAQCGPQPTADAIAGDRVTHDPADGERDARRLPRGSDDGGSHLEIPGAPAPAAGQRLKRRLTTDAPDQAERFARPLERRRRITARPARLRIRSRKPCFFFRLRLFGWYVRFIHGLLERPGRGKGPGAGARQLLSTRASGRMSLRAVRDQQQSNIHQDSSDDSPDDSPAWDCAGVQRANGRRVGFSRTLSASMTRASVRSPVDR
jgi:hypothetical protein